MARTLARQALPVVAAIFVAALVVQVFLAGLGVFDDPASFITHRDFGYMIGWLAIAMLILAVVGREPRRIVGISILLIVLFTLQSVFVGLREDQPTIAALHPLNGFLILGLTVVVTKLSWDVRRGAGLRSDELHPVSGLSRHRCYPGGSRWLSTTPGSFFSTCSGCALRRLPWRVDVHGLRAAPTTRTARRRRDAGGEPARHPIGLRRPAAADHRRGRLPPAPPTSGASLADRVGRDPDRRPRRRCMRSRRPTTWACARRSATGWAGTEGSPVVDEAALVDVLDTRRPDILLTVGGLGLVVLVWLMVLKPA